MRFVLWNGLRLTSGEGEHTAILGRDARSSG
jgi:hypothetical protein